MLQNLIGNAQRSRRTARIARRFRYTSAMLALDPTLVRDRGLRAVVRWETGRRDARGRRFAGDPRRQARGNRSGRAAEDAGVLSDEQVTRDSTAAIHAIRVTRCLFRRMAAGDGYCLSIAGRRRRGCCHACVG